MKRNVEQRLYAAWERENHSARVKVRQRRYQAAQREKVRAIVAEAKDRPCADCGQSYHPAAMDLHHRDPGDKRFNFGHFQKTSALPGHTREETLRLEIAKCDILCATCHRLRHYAL